MITSVGNLGRNVMAAEWTMQISYEPLLIAVFLNEDSITLKNIHKTKEFGVNVASETQSNLVNIAGGYSRSEVDKLRVKHAFTFLKSKFIKSPLIAGCTINAECKLFFMRKIGDHFAVIGKVISMRYDKTKLPLLYHTGRYFHRGSLIEPIRQHIKVNNITFDWFSKESNGRFILKCVGVKIKSGGTFLVLKHFKNDLEYETIPYIIPPRGVDFLQSMQKYLKPIGLKIKPKQEPILKRLVLKNNGKIQRINFVLYEGLKNKTFRKSQWRVKTNSLLKALDD